MLQTRLITYADLGLGIRASGRLPKDVFRMPLDRTEEALPEELRTAGINQWRCPFARVRFTREAPGGYDILCRQQVATLASDRPLYQAV